MREKRGISETAIQTCLEQNYNLITQTLEFLPLGDDANAWVYRVVDQAGTSYFLKIKQVVIYPPAYLVPYFLSEQAISAIATPIPNTQNELWTHLSDLILILYPFIEGDNRWKLGLTDKHWKELGSTFKNIHAQIPPPELLVMLRKETFDPQQYRWLNEFDRQVSDWKTQTRTEAEFISIWRTNQPAIHTIMGQMKKLAEVLRYSSGKNVICHADLHPGNILINPADELFIIDWDEVMVAPKERDFLFVATDGEAALSSPFFQGYGKNEIDWVALIYYRCERVVQDLMEDAQRIFVRTDLGEETKAEALTIITEYFEAGGWIEMIFRAARRLPEHLRFR